MVLFIIFTVLAPLTEMFVIFGLIFTCCQVFVISRLIDTVRVVIVNWEDNEIHSWKLRTREYKKYKKLDWQGRDTTDKYRLKSDDGYVIFGDRKNSLERIMRIQKCCTNIEFIERYKERIERLSKVCTKQMNKIIELVTDKEYKTVKRTYELYEEHPILEEAFEKEEEISKEELEKIIDKMLKSVEEEEIKVLKENLEVEKNE